MATTEQSTTPPAPADRKCASCRAPLAPDQRYCLSCGARGGEPRVPLPSASAPGPEAATPDGRSSDVSPLAAVIGIALLGGMLLIGVLIGRGSNDEPPAPVIQVGDPTSAAATGDEGAPAPVTSEWPQGTDGWTIQVSTVAKQDATAEDVDAAKQVAVDGGAADAAVLDSDLYASLPPGNYVIYSGVFTDRKSAEVALRGLRKAFPAAAVVEVSSDAGTSGSGSGGEGASASESPSGGSGAGSTRSDAAASGAGAAAAQAGEAELSPDEQATASPPVSSQQQQQNQSPDQ